MANIYSRFGPAKFSTVPNPNPAIPMGPPPLGGANMVNPNSVNIGMPQPPSYTGQGAGQIPGIQQPGNLGNMTPPPPVPPTMGERMTPFAAKPGAPMDAMTSGMSRAANNPPHVFTAEGMAAQSRAGAVGAGTPQPHPYSAMARDAASAAPSGKSGAVRAKLIPDAAPRYVPGGAGPGPLTKMFGGAAPGFLGTVGSGLEALQIGHDLERVMAAQGMSHQDLGLPTGQNSSPALDQAWGMHQPTPPPLSGQPVGMGSADPIMNAFPLTSGAGVPNQSLVPEVAPPVLKPVGSDQRQPIDMTPAIGGPTSRSLMADDHFSSIMGNPLLDSGTGWVRPSDGPGPSYVIAPNGDILRKGDDGVISIIHEGPGAEAYAQEIEAAKAADAKKAAESMRLNGEFRERIGAQADMVIAGQENDPMVKEARLKAALARATGIPELRGKELELDAAKEARESARETAEKNTKASTKSAEKRAEVIAKGGVERAKIQAQSRLDTELARTRGRRELSEYEASLPNLRAVRQLNSKGGEDVVYYDTRKGPINATPAPMQGPADGVKDKPIPEADMPKVQAAVASKGKEYVNQWLLSRGYKPLD